MSDPLDMTLVTVRRRQQRARSTRSGNGERVEGKQTRRAPQKVNVSTGRLRWFEPYRVVIRVTPGAEQSERLVLVRPKLARTVVVPHPRFGLVGERLKGLHDVDEAVHVKHPGLAIHRVPQRFA
jgi:hypothetical protein